MSNGQGYARQPLVLPSGYRPSVIRRLDNPRGWRPSVLGPLDNPSGYRPSAIGPLDNPRGWRPSVLGPTDPRKAPPRPPVPHPFDSPGDDPWGDLLNFELSDDPFGGVLNRQAPPRPPVPPQHNPLSSGYRSSEELMKAVRSGHRVGPRPAVKVFDNFSPGSLPEDEFVDPWDLNYVPGADPSDPRNRGWEKHVRSWTGPRKVSPRPPVPDPLNPGPIRSPIPAFVDPFDVNYVPGADPPDPRNRGWGQHVRRHTDPRLVPPQPPVPPQLRNGYRNGPRPPMWRGND